jgi:C_GCAxxG_C_C family probable redox protein
MDKNMAIERAMNYVEEGFLCVEAVFKTLADIHGTDSELVPKVATGLAAGIARTSNICGAISGAILGLGLWFGRNEPVEGERKVYWYSRKYIDDWLKGHPSTNCTELLGVDLDISEEVDQFYAENMWEKKCKRYISEAVSLAIDILVEEGYSVGA